MIHSMTGFGAAEGPWGRGRLLVEVRSVNHRFFNPTLKLPPRLQRWEAEVREALRSRVARGHVTLSARLEEVAVGGVAVDEARVAAYAEQLRGLTVRLGLTGGVDIATILRLPEVLRPADEVAEPADGTLEELMKVVDEATMALLTMRTAEGERLAAELEERLAVLEEARQRIAGRAPQRLVEHRDRLRAAVTELLDGATMDEQRLAQEVALLAERLDIQEELARFGGHITAFRDALDTDADEAVGKRLGFVLQEMLRETNTTGSKANDSAVLRDVLIMKEELERLREQVENVE
ncbi:MAG: YicC/YloC family endoribonuclease [Gemmatimonadaceae bacterium]